jgi:8-oxo-dGTP diphosphatase/2-hydroxy-dATP diphosphatase
MKKQLTLCIPVKENKVLLGYKKRGLGLGLYNGFGGKVELGETIEQATLRELAEEVGIKDGVLKKLGVLEFTFQSEQKILVTHIFKLKDFKQEPIETEEMKPQWFNLNEIPFLQMWPDDKYWFPLFLQDKLFKGYFLFDKPSNAEYESKILEHKLESV